MVCLYIAQSMLNFFLFLVIVVQSGKTTVLHDVQLLQNKQQQIWGGVYIHGYFWSSTDTVVLPPKHLLRDRSHILNILADPCQLDRCSSSQSRYRI